MAGVTFFKAGTFSNLIDDSDNLAAIGVSTLASSSLFWVIMSEDLEWIRLSVRYNYRAEYAILFDAARHWPQVDPY